MLATIAHAQSVPAQDTQHAPAQPHDWSGLYIGAHLGLATGHSDWTAPPGASGSIGLYQGPDIFNNSGSWFGGVQAGYNHMFPDRVLIGGEADISFPSFATLPNNVNPFGVSIGGTSGFTSAQLGPASLAETALTSGTARVRLGYAPGDWLFYVTGGFAWTYNQQSLTQVSTGNGTAPYLWRLGWTAGAGVETTIAPHWTARLEYLFTDFGQHTINYFDGAQPIRSNWQVNQVRVGLNYFFGGGQDQASDAPATRDDDRISLHGQSTFVAQGYTRFRSPYQGANSLPGGGEARETFDATLYAGVRLWQGAELWVNPEIDQGFGLASTHGLAGFSSGEAYKKGTIYPYALVNRFFVRQTIDLGGEALSIEADQNQFARKTTENRVVLTAGKFSVTDIFDTNKYANSARTQF
ncbi:MAG: outer membrane beta-barrel protein, partial [Acetobacteraceae bacterium]|nr:outer membrane beta-barrel protein [Acetobacteraceae bacterium]